MLGLRFSFRSNFNFAEKIVIAGMWFVLYKS